MKYERGGTLVGFIVGVVVGLGIALGVAMYITKVPVPFMNKSQSRTPDQDAAEAQKNKNWDPNAILYGKNPAPAVPTAVAPSAASAPAAAPVAAPAAGAKAPSQSDVKTDAKADAKSDAKPDTKAAKADAKGENKPAVSADPLGDLAKAKAGIPAESDAFTYYIQVGAFQKEEDAESYRAKLSLSGIETKTSEREQSGHPVFRVRVGPFDKKEDADKAKDKLDKAGLTTALVRVSH